MIPGLLSTAAHLMNETSIIVSDSHIESCVLYTALVANPGTGKSQSLGFFERGLGDIDEYMKIDDDKVGLVRGMINKYKL